MSYPQPIFGRMSSVDVIFFYLTQMLPFSVKTCKMYTTRVILTGIVVKIFFNRKITAKIRFSKPTSRKILRCTNYWPVLNSTEDVLCGKFFETFVILLAILLSIKSQVASALFSIVLFGEVLGATVTDCLVWSRSFWLYLLLQASLIFFHFSIWDC